MRERKGSSAIGGLNTTLYVGAISHVCLVHRALSSQQLTLASVMVVDTPGLRNPRHSAEERGASWSELCHNYLQERLLEHCHTHTFTHTLERYGQVTTYFSPTRARFQSNESDIWTTGEDPRGAGEPREQSC